MPQPIAVKVNVFNSQGWPEGHYLNGYVGDVAITPYSFCALIPDDDGIVVVWPNGGWMLVEAIPQLQRMWTTAPAGA